MNSPNSNRINISTLSPDYLRNKLSDYSDYHDKLLWWNSLTGEQQQDWLKIFISNTHFIPYPHVDRHSSKKKMHNHFFSDEEDNLPNLISKLDETIHLNSPVNENVPSCDYENIPPSTREFIEHQVNQCKNYIDECDNHLTCFKNIKNKH